MNKTFTNQLISSSYFTIGALFLRELNSVIQEIMKVCSFLIQIFRLNEGRENLQGCPKHPSEINYQVCKVLFQVQDEGPIVYRVYHNYMDYRCSFGYDSIFKADEAEVTFEAEQLILMMELKYSTG